MPRMVLVTGDCAHVSLPDVHQLAVDNGFHHHNIIADVDRSETGR